MFGKRLFNLFRRNNIMLHFAISTFSKPLI